MTLALERFPTTDDWAHEAATRIAQTLREGQEKNSWASLACAGGSTPTPIYRRLGPMLFDWQHVFVTLVDERFVAEGHPDSNAALIKRELLQGQAKDAVFLPLYHPTVTVDRAAALAANNLGEETQRLDAVLLGMGEDGHIASMFPHSPTLKTLLTPGAKPTVLGVPQGRDGLAPSMERLSLNLPYLAQAGRVILAITGAAKRAVFEREALGDPATQPIAALVQAGAPLEVLWTENAP